MNIAIEDVVRVVSDEIAKKKKLKKPIDADTRLFEEGLVDSFGLVDIIAALEKKVGTAFEEGALMPDDFESPRVLHARLQELD